MATFNAVGVDADGVQSALHIADRILFARQRRPRAVDELLLNLATCSNAEYENVEQQILRLCDDVEQSSSNEKSTASSCGVSSSFQMAVFQHDQPQSSILQEPQSTLHEVSEQSAGSSSGHLNPFNSADRRQTQQSKPGPKLKIDNDDSLPSQTKPLLVYSPHQQQHQQEPQLEQQYPPILNNNSDAKFQHLDKNNDYNDGGSNNNNNKQFVPLTSDAAVELNSNRTQQCVDALGNGMDNSLLPLAVVNTSLAKSAYEQKAAYELEIAENAQKREAAIQQYRVDHGCMNTLRLLVLTKSPKSTNTPQIFLYVKRLRFFDTDFKTHPHYSVFDTPPGVDPKLPEPFRDKKGYSELNCSMVGVVYDVDAFQKKQLIIGHDKFDESYKYCLDNVMIHNKINKHDTKGKRLFEVHDLFGRVGVRVLIRTDTSDVPVIDYAKSFFEKWYQSLV